MCKLCNGTGWRRVPVTDPVLPDGSGPTYWTELPCPCQQEPEPPEIDPFEEPPEWLLYSQQQEEG